MGATCDVVKRGRRRCGLPAVTKVAGRNLCPSHARYRREADGRLAKQAADLMKRERSMYQQQLRGEATDHLERIAANPPDPKEPISIQARMVARQQAAADVLASRQQGGV